MQTQYTAVPITGKIVEELNEKEEYTIIRPDKSKDIFTGLELKKWMPDTLDAITHILLPSTQTLFKPYKQCNKLTIEKAALFGIIDAMLEEIPSLKKRENFRQRIANFKLIEPMGWCDELPYEITYSQTQQG